MITVAQETVQPEKDAFWYKSGVIYEVNVRAFNDSDANGVGDFPGLTEKLDYLRDLGVTALWLLPFYPSPLRDDGYDIADYCSIHPMYGTLSDFKVFLREAHRRGLRVITELVLNHTSDQHPWFQRARRAKPGSRWRDFYVWSDTPDKYKDTRIIFKDYETSNWAWDPIANAYYWHRFYSHQPDLNFDNPHVHKEVFKALDFWLDMGVDGLRLDAVPYLYEREGTGCENLSETHAFLKKLRQHVDQKYGDRMLLAEANQWPEDAVAYFGGGKGDECHMAFHFPLMPRLFMALRMEDRVPIVDILQQTPAIPETSQWALFLRNHDELTLEMVTDEERDYMYRMYAHIHLARLNLGIRRRLAPLLGNDRKRIELLNALLFSLPGTPVLYYGDEIGMGENVYLGDRNGVRTPMQWSSDRNAGFSRANPQSLYLPVILDPEYHFEASNVEAQHRNTHSLLWWMRRMLALRKRWRALGEGQIEFLQPENRKILTYILRYKEEKILVLANLSRFVQPVELDLTAFKQMAPVELFGRTEFPPISDQPYFMTLGPHAFYWFSLEPRFAAEHTIAAIVADMQQLPQLSVPDRWDMVLQEKNKARLEQILPGYIKHRRWFGGKAKIIKSVVIEEIIPVQLDSNRSLITLLNVDYVQGDPELYVLPLAFISEPESEQLFQSHPQLAICRLKLPDQNGILYDAIGDKAFCRALLETMTRRRQLKGRAGEVIATGTQALRNIRAEMPDDYDTVVGKAEQSNSAVIYCERLMLKLFRRLERGINPDLEIGKFLTARQFPHVPLLAGALEYRRPKEEAMSMAVLTGFIPDCKDAWEYSLDALGRYYERISSSTAELVEIPIPPGSLVQLAAAEIPQSVPETVGTYIESARLLGERTAELHLVLASETAQSSFAPEPFTPHYQRGIYQSMRNLAIHNLQLLRKRLKQLPEAIVQEANTVQDSEADIIKRYRSIYETRINALRIRCHGDFHLGQVLYTGKDFVIIDFEGEPARSLSERRIKRSPLRDVAGMIRSFHYVAYAALFKQVDRGSISPENMPKFEPWAMLWYKWVSAAYLKAYLEIASKSAFLPRTEVELRIMLEAFLLDKAVYELGYELNNRPAWLRIPLQGIMQLVEPSSTA